ncbi:MAG TPA: hypothetical protein VIL65_09270 [Beijerinckiaceae bacterium]|jgi:predicted transcriptional regulator
MSSTVTVQINEETLAAFDAYAHRIDQSRDVLLTQALEEWLTVQNWQLEQIDAGIADAEAGNFASDEEVAAIFAKHGIKYGARR